MSALTTPIPLWQDLPDGPSAMKPFGYAIGYDMADPRWNEPLVDLAGLGLLTKSWYDVDDGSNPPYGCKIEGSVSGVFLRSSAAALCVKADRLVQDLGLRLLFVDGFRSPETQRGLWNFYQSDIKRRKPELKGEDLHKETMIYVSYGEVSEDDPNSWFVHVTGGSIDVLLYDPARREILNCGVEFDDSTPAVFTDHLERLLQSGAIGEDDEALRNRRIIYNAMTQAGFTNYPYEYFHYDFGTILHSVMRRSADAKSGVKAWYGMAKL